jgi:hypothetical protein
MLAGTAAGADRGQPGRCGGRETGLQFMGTQPGQYRGVPGIGVQELSAQPVDQQHARRGDLTRQVDPVVEARHPHRGQHRRNHVGQVRDVRIRMGEVHSASLPQPTEAASSASKATLN